MKLLKRSDGRPSTSMTLVWISFYFCLGAILLGLFEEITLGTFTLKVRMIDATIVFALLGPAYSLYGFRRYVDNKLKKSIED